MKMQKFALPTFVLTALLSSCTPLQSSQGTEAGLRAAATASGVSDFSVTPRADGGLNVTGKLAGNAFALRVPPKWNGQSLLFAHGYATPTPDAKEMTPDPTQDAAVGIMTAAYNQGFIAADSAYAKVGYAVKEGVQANKTLRDFLVKAGSKRNYMAGVSMGGNITVALIEQYPNDFAGALTLCGVTPGWRSEMRYLLDYRAVYDALTKGTPYALPGNGDSIKPNPAYTQEAVFASVSGLFMAAGKGDVAAKSIIGQVAKVTGVMPDPISFIVPLSVTITGLDDLLSTMNGIGYSNVGKGYAGSADDSALNANVQRLTASAASSAYLDANYTATGKFKAKLLTVHNTSDPLVPSLFVPEFAGIVNKAGNSSNLVQQWVDAKPVNLADLANSGPAHCYFKPAQMVTAWNELRGWVEHEVRPPDGVNITNAQ